MVGKRRIASIALALVFGAVPPGCSAGDAPDEPSVSATPGLPEAAGRALTAEEAEAALLTAEDLGADWSTTAQAADPFGAAGPVASDPACQPFVDAFVGAGTWGLGTPSTEADAVFRRDGGGFLELEQVVATVASHPGPIDTGLLDELAASIERCRRFAVTADGMTSTVDLSPLPQTRRGDAVLAVRLEVTVAFLGGVAEITSVAIGQNLLTVAVLGLGDVDPTLLPRLVDVAVERLVAVTAPA